MNKILCVAYESIFLPLITIMTGFSLKPNEILIWKETRDINQRTQWDSKGREGKYSWMGRINKEGKVRH
jgi:hypothetical protein